MNSVIFVVLHIIIEQFTVFMNELLNVFLTITAIAVNKPQLLNNIRKRGLVVLFFYNGKGSLVKTNKMLHTSCCKILYQK